MHRVGGRVLASVRLLAVFLLLLGGVSAVVNIAASGSADTDPGPASPSPTAAPSPVRTVPPSPRPAPTAAPTVSPSVVGALFAPSGSSHFCTAAVVDSPSGDVIVTAAHCLAGTGVGLRFVPGYGPSGSGPVGTWTVTGAYTDAAWLSDQDIAHDYAFLSVAPADGAPRGRTLQALVGAASLSVAPAAGQRVQAIGYPAGSDDAPITCSTPVTVTADGGSGSPTVACPGFRAGTSGSPWIAHGRSGDQLVGLVGGLHQGGCSDDISHSPAFDATAVAVLGRAAAGGSPDTLPAPDDDGC